MPDESSAEEHGDFAAVIEELQRESRERQAELKSIADGLPAVTSRRTVIRAMVVSIGDAPDRLEVVRRTLAKLARIPADLVRALRSASSRSASSR